MITQELQTKIDRSIRLLQSVQKGYNGEIEVAYSGGKDSDVILQLAKEAGIRYRAIYKNTTIDPPGTIAHVKRMGVEIRRPKNTFFQIIAKKGLPNRFTRFCCSELKEYKILDKSIIGVRKEESAKRNKMYNEPTACHWYGKKTEENHVEHIYPILDWTREDILAYIEDRKIQLAPIYYESGGANQYTEASRLHGMPIGLEPSTSCFLQGKATHGFMLHSGCSTFSWWASSHKDRKTLR